MKMNRRFRDDETGASLIIALLFMVVFSLIIAAIFSNAGANFRNSVNVRNDVTKTYAADGGAEWAAQYIRNEDTACPTSTKGIVKLIGVPSFPTATGGSVTPVVTCEVVGGTNVTGLGGWALITTSSSTPSFSTAGPAFAKTVNGPVWSSGIQDTIDNVTVNNGDVYERASGTTCSADSDKPANLTIQPSALYGYHCDSTNTAASILAGVDHAQASASLATSTPMASDGDKNKNCRVFKPGRYTSLQLASDNYFESGVYFFDNVGTIDVTKLQIVGGLANADEASTTLLTPCTTSDSSAGSTTGVKFILGGNSAFSVGNPSGRMELFARHGGDTSTEGTQDISVETVTSDWTSWTSKVSTLTDTGSTADVLTEGKGNTPLVAIHGAVYAPNAIIDFDATNGARAYLLGGAAAGKLVLRQQATIDGLRVSITTGIGSRIVRVISRVRNGTEREIVTTEILSIKNDSSRTTTVLSRRVDCHLPSSSDTTLAASCGKV